MISTDKQSIDLHNKANYHAENIELKRNYDQQRRISYPLLCELRCVTGHSFRDISRKRSCFFFKGMNVQEEFFFDKFTVEVIATDDSLRNVRNQINGDEA